MLGRLLVTKSRALRGFLGHTERYEASRRLGNPKLARLRARRGFRYGDGRIDRGRRGSQTGDPARAGQNGRELADALRFGVYKGRESVAIDVAVLHRDRP